MASDYVHGFSRAEQYRLTLMQRILNEAELRELDLDGVRSILDIGSGLGQLTRAFARVVGPEGRVLGIERDERQLREAQRQAEVAGETDLVGFRPGDALALPLSDDEAGSFDLVHARFLLEHLEQPLAAVREMVRAARPGGRVVLVDDDHELLRLWPDCDAFVGTWARYWKSYRDRGCDPLVGRRLAGLLHEAGAPPTRVTTVFYGAVRGGSLFAQVIDNLAAVIEGSAEVVCRAEHLTQAELTGAVTALREWAERPGATVWYSLPLAEGTRSD